MVLLCVPMMCSLAKLRRFILEKHFPPKVFIIYICVIVKLYIYTLDRDVVFLFFVIRICSSIRKLRGSGTKIMMHLIPNAVTLIAK